MRNLTKTEEGLVFRVSINLDKLTERAAAYIPGRLFEVNNEGYVRILSVSKKHASLGLYETLAAARRDKDGSECVELIAPTVTAATLSHLGVHYADHEGWMQDGEESSAAEGSEAEEAEESERESGNEDEVESDGDEGEEGEDMVAVLSKAIGIRDLDALERLAQIGLSSAADLKLLKEGGAEFAREVAEAAGLSAFDTRRLVVFAMSGEPTPRSMGGGALRRADSGGFGLSGNSFLNTLQLDGASESGDEEAGRGSAVSGGVGGCSSEPPRSTGGGIGGCSSEPPRSMGGEALRRAASGGFGRNGSGLPRQPARRGEPTPQVQSGAVHAGGIGSAGGGVTGGGGRALETEVGETKRLLGGAPQSEWTRISGECLEYLAPALVQRAPRQPEMRRPLKQLDIWLRAAAAKGVVISAAAPGDEDQILDAVQEACAQLELPCAASGRAVGGVGGGQWGGEGAAVQTLMMAGGGGALSAERLDDDRAILESLMHVATNQGYMARVEDIASRSPGDPSIAAAAAELGGHMKMRPLVYMNASSIQAPAGMVATQANIRLIGNSKRVRALLVAQLAERLRKQLPTAGMKVDTAGKLAEAVITGALVSKIKLHEVFQPTGGSMLLAGGGKKAKEQLPTELFARGINLLTVAYQFAHGSFDFTIIETFGQMFSSFLDATQKGIEPARAAAFVVEPVLHELERQWRRATSGLQELRPIIGEVAVELRPHMLQTLSVEVAAATMQSSEAPRAKTKEKEGEKVQPTLESLQKSLMRLERSVAQRSERSADGPGKGSGGEGKGTKGKRVSWREKIDAWDQENPGRCWYVENQKGGCRFGKECPNWYEGHPEKPETK